MSKTKQQAILITNNRKYHLLILGYDRQEAEWVIKHEELSNPKEMEKVSAILWLNNLKRPI